MAKKTKRSAKKPSNAAMAAAKAMLAPLHDLLKASVAQSEINSGLLTTLNDRMAKLAGQLDRLQQVAPAEKLLTEPAPPPSNARSLTE